MGPTMHLKNVLPAMLVPALLVSCVSTPQPSRFQRTYQANPAVAGSSLPPYGEFTQLRPVADPILEAESMKQRGSFLLGQSYYQHSLPPDLEKLTELAKSVGADVVIYGKYSLGVTTELRTVYETQVVPAPASQSVTVNGVATASSQSATQRATTEEVRRQVPVSHETYQWQAFFFRSPGGN